MNIDVAIIGASSSGLYAAEQLALAGRRVAVFERQSALSPTRRTLIITPQMVHLLGYIPDDAVLHRIDVMAVDTPGASVNIKLNEPDLIVERSRLAQHLAERAQIAGAKIYYGYRFQGLTPHARTAAVHFRRADQTTAITAQTIIGADGAFSNVALAAGIKRPPTVPIVQAEIELPPGWDPAMTKVWFDADETRFFYWLVPESATHGVLGLVGDDQTDTHGLLQRFMERHGLRPLAYQGAQVAMHHPRLRPWGRVGGAQVFLIGDAAGQVKVTTVGGTVSGFWGAAAAVRAIVGNTSHHPSLRSLKRELDLHWFIRFLVERLDNSGYDRLVHAITPFVQEFLGRHNRDSMAGKFWQVPLREPRLLLLGLQLLLAGPTASSPVSASRPTKSYPPT